MLTESTKPITRWLGLVLCIACFIHVSASMADTGAQSKKTGDLAFWEELAFWESIKNSKDPAEYQAYLAAFPNGRFARLAEIRIGSLTDGSTPKVQITVPKPSIVEETSAPRVDPAPNPNLVPSRDSTSTFQDCDNCPLMVKIPAGTYLMGSDQNRPNEKPRHEVRFSTPFAIGVHEVTVGEWDACLREGGCRLSPESGSDDRLPMGNLSWDDTQQYLAWLTKKTGHDYRLPTEAEWEYAASGGKTTSFWWGESVAKGNANCTDCGSPWDGLGPAPVGSFKPNPFGLYDVHGNLWEWTMDCMNRSYEGAPSDGSAWLRGDCLARMLRGGSWNLESDYMRTTRRNEYDRDVRYYLHGFRVARSLGPDPAD